MTQEKSKKSIKYWIILLSIVIIGYFLITLFEKGEALGVSIAK